LIESKRRQIIDFIAKNCVDPKTGTPHPPLRIENALSQAKVQIDPFKSVEEQANEIIKALRTILPLKISQATFYVKLPPQYASRAYSVLCKMGTVSSSNWGSDGSWSGEITIPAGLQQVFIDRVNELTKGEAEVKIVKRA
ncbi:MAG: ribosome assembly factor SBDS, partial [Candidatus Methanomethylicota archaeon]